jgi:hypothetical protein
MPTSLCFGSIHFLDSFRIGLQLAPFLDELQRAVYHMCPSASVLLCMSISERSASTPINHQFHPYLIGFTLYIEDIKIMSFHISNYSRKFIVKIKEKYLHSINTKYGTSLNNLNSIVSYCCWGNFILSWMHGVAILGH